MIETIQLLVVLLIVVAGVAVLSAHLKIPAAILLMLAGVILALIPGLPTITLAPEFVLLMVLPLLIYSASVAMSWREFKFNLRPIALLAVGCVVFTTVAAARSLHCREHTGDDLPVCTRRAQGSRLTAPGDTEAA